jgi:hypothetical protein
MGPVASGLFRELQERMRNGFFALQRNTGRDLAKPGGRSRDTPGPAVYFTPDGAQVASPQSLILRWSKTNLPKPTFPQLPHNLRSFKKLWSIRPNGKSAKNWSVRLFGNEEDECSRLQIEWIAHGFTAVCFWTVPWRLITALESLMRFSLRAGLRLTRLSPNRCLAGLLHST